MPSYDNSYLDKTPNKWQRGPSDKIEMVVWHETASPSPDNPYGTLDYNLSPRVQSSYHYLIARGGTIFHYVNEKQWIAYHSGVQSHARGYTGWSVNVHSLGVELDGANDGTPITAAQQRAIAALMVYFRQSYGIPIDRAYHLGHREVAPGYKSDPRGYDLDAVVAAAQQETSAPQTDASVIGVQPSITLARFQAAMTRNQAPLSADEQERIYQVCEWLEIDPAFFVALWAHEGGRPFGSSLQQQRTHCPLNLRDAAGSWEVYESFQLGALAGLVYLKQRYGAAGLLTVRQITPVFAPASDGNNVEAYVTSVLEDMAYMRAH